MLSGRQLACAALAAVALVAGVSAAASAPRGWQTIPVGKAVGVFPLGAASGRVWFVAEGLQGGYTVWSARYAGGRLSSFVSTSEGPDEGLATSFIFGSSLVNCCATSTSSSEAPLLASGKVGAWSPLAGNPEKTAEDALIPADQQLDNRWLARGEATTGGRTVFAIDGHTCPKSSSAPHQCTINGGGYAWLVACCNAEGQPSDLSSLLTKRTKSGATNVSLALDSQGRLWLGWLDGATSSPGVALRLVQLDPATLKPVSAHVLDHVLLYQLTQVPFSFTCAAACRLVYPTSRGAFSWGGTGSPTRLWAVNIRKDKGGGLLGAGVRAGGLDAANYGNRVPHNPDDGQRMTLKHGDALGRHLRAVRSINIPGNLPAGGTHYFFPMGVPAVAFTPKGMVVFGLYNDESGSGFRSRLLAALLHG